MTIQQSRKQFYSLVSRFYRHQSLICIAKEPEVPKAKISIYLLEVSVLHSKEISIRF